MKWLTILAVLSCQTSSAEVEKKAPAQKKVFISFDEDLVQGSMTGAELFLILQKKQTKFDHLFELKDDFTDQMITDAENLK